MQALYSNTTGSNNTASGLSALNYNTTGYQNTANGVQALNYNTTGFNNTANGMQALYSNTTGSSNTASGAFALFYNTSATSSTALGYFAAAGGANYHNQGGTYLGYQSGYSAATGSDYNTLLGYQSGYGDTTGTRNVLIGPSTITASQNQVTTGSNNIAIGNDVAVASPTASNQLTIGNLIYGTGLNGTGATLSTGNIGIGTTTPLSTLTVTGSGCFSKGAGATLLCGTTAGSIYYNVANTGAYDVAENYLATNALPVATLVGLDANNPGFITTATNATSLLGVVSTAPGMVLGGADGATVGQTVAPVALSGRVPVSVSLGNGPINVGDRLALSSTTPGVAVKALHSGQTIGIALSAYSGAGQSKVNMFVSPQYWFAPSDFSIDPTSGNIGIGTTTANHTLTVAGDVGAIAFVNTSTRTAKNDISYVDASTTDQMLGQLLQLKVATYRYKIENQNDPLRLGFIAEDAQKIAPEVLSPDGKGVDLYKLATFTLSGVQALAAKVNGQDLRLTSLETRVTKLENGSITTASGSPVSFSSSTLASALSGFGALIQKGIAQFGTIVANQFVAATNSAGTASAGSVTILKGNTVAQVNNAYVKSTTKVFVTFNAQVTGSWWVSDKATGSFRIVLSAPQTTDVSFDYFLVQTEGQIATSTPDGNFGSAGTVPSASQSAGPDTVGPVITLLGDNPVHLSVGSTFVEPGVTIADSVDGTDPYITFVNGIQQPISSSTIDTSSPTTYIITYKATDQAGNSATAMRSVIVGNPDGTVSTGAASGASGASGSGQTSTASSTPPVATTATSTPVTPADTTPPVVTLVGAAAMQLTVGGTFTNPGATALDAVDGNLTSKIKETGTVDTATVGLYTLGYSATDNAGNTGSVSRVVSIVAAPAAITSTPTSTTTSTATATTTPPTNTTSSTSTASSTPQ